MEWSNV
jgi:hypothetical protein